MVHSIAGHPVDSADPACVQPLDGVAPLKYFGLPPITKSFSEVQEHAYIEPLATGRDASVGPDAT
ncbi:hypothetical protein SBA5_590039 [Candidatus Sulfotelmatomonas gaucii]|uniref:Uncharacterized protein n=1 Tax=Candidatus Sulfuritelmatomonas gaucii TaxID=2043161 RepID=A0A2N9LVR5_9BACT|nr:hypothetical protein SBA5_590039 [Candidatus Sulfotelmatomonas gaucii]